MSEESKGVSDALDNTVSDSAQENQQTAVSDSGDNQTVQYHTHKKLLGQYKRTAEELEQMREQVKALETQKYEAEGNKDKLIDTLKKEINETKGKLKQTVGSVARSQAMNAIVEEAVKAGCNAPDVVKKFLEDQIQTLTFDQDFVPDRDQVRELIEEARKTAPVLFSKEAPKIANHNTSAGSGSAVPKKDLRKLKMDELIDLWGQS